MGFTLVRSNRKSLAIAVKSGGVVEVRAPIRVAMPVIEKFITDNAEWIEVQLKKQLQKQRTAPTHRFEAGELFWFLGERYSLRYDPSASKTLDLKDELILHTASQYRARMLFEKWYRARAASYISDQIKALAPIMEVQVNSIKITGATTRWGSCSAGGKVNFCWRLIMAPPAIINYVIVHELAHIRHANHSKQFWGLVQQFDPRWREHRKWLRAQGHMLVL
jgi:predicted metal-dependent hydrolase